MTPIRRIQTAVVATLILSVVSCASLGNASTSKADDPMAGYEVKEIQHGKASWYSIRTNRGTKTASGERLDERAATAAHKTLPMGTKVRVTNLKNGNSEVVRINDRGPYIKGRIIDVTIGTAERLGFVRSGVVPVKVEVLKKIDDE